MLTFLKTVKPFFPNEYMVQNKTATMDKNFLITKEENLAKTLNTFFFLSLVNLKSPKRKGF